MPATRWMLTYFILVLSPVLILGWAASGWNGGPLPGSLSSAYAKDLADSEKPVPRKTINRKPGISPITARPTGPNAALYEHWLKTVQARRSTQ